VVNLTKFLFILSLFLLTSCEFNKQRVLAQEVEPDIIIQIRSPDYIKKIGRIYGYRNALGLSHHGEIPCRILVPELTRQTMTLWQHEIRHRREGSWHN